MRYHWWSVLQDEFGRDNLYEKLLNKKIEEWSNLSKGENES